MSSDATKGWIRALNEETEHLHREVEIAFRAGWMAGSAGDDLDIEEKEKLCAHDWKNYEKKRKIK